MTSKPKIGLISLCLLALAACSSPKPPLIEYRPPPCPAVPDCHYQRPHIGTNGELLQALLDAEHALQQCQIAQRTLLRCLND